LCATASSGETAPHPPATGNDKPLSNTGLRGIDMDSGRLCTAHRFLFNGEPRERPRDHPQIAQIAQIKTEESALLTHNN